MAASQFPQFSPLEHYKAINERDLVKPTTINDAAYAKATSIYNQAKNSDIDLGKQATARGIRQHDLIGEGNKFNTKDTAALLEQGNYKDANAVFRPAIKEIEPGVRLIPTSEVRNELISQAKAASGIDDADRQTLIKQITKRYAPGSAADLAHPRGYSLTDLHDARIAAQPKSKFTPGISTPPAVLSAKLSRLEGAGFKKLFDENIPEKVTLNGQTIENPLKELRREFEGNFKLADYLRSLHNKKVPQSLVQKGTSLFARAAGGALGAKFGGYPGFLFGSRGGEMLFSSFEALPNPIKIGVLRQLQNERSPVYSVLEEYLHATQQERLLMKALPVAGGSSFKPTRPTLFATPKGVITPDKGAAIDLTAVEKGTAKAPKSGRSAAAQKKLVQYIQENNQGPYVAPKDLPVIKAGTKPKAPKRLNDIL